MSSAIAMPFVARNLPKPVGVALKPPSSGAVRQQLSMILGSEGFIRANRMRRFLKFIVEETLAGRSSQLCEYNIGISVFEQDESFEPGVNPIVRNDARRLRQKLLEYYHRSRDNPNQVVIDIPKGSYVPVFSFVSGARTSGAGRQYRLTVRLTRIADGAEIWAAEHEY
jgi:hypothetical protein